MQPDFFASLWDDTAEPERRSDGSGMLRLMQQASGYGTGQQVGTHGCSVFSLFSSVDLPYATINFTKQ